MAHRRHKKQKYIAKKKRANSPSFNEAFNKLESNIKNEKKLIQVNNNNVKYVAISLIVVISVTGLIALSNINPVGQTSFTNTNTGDTLGLPSNMPSKYDQTLTQEPTLSNTYTYASTEAGEQLLSQLVCYCGCNNTMHRPYHENNKECFWTSTGAYEPHAETCSTCIYIALSGKILYENNWTVSNIRAYIDSQYT